MRTTARVSGRARRALDQLHDKGLNFDADRRHELTTERGWHIDDYRSALPPEVPGPPVPGGSWEAARRLLEVETVESVDIRPAAGATRPAEHLKRQHRRDP